MDHTEYCNQYLNEDYRHYIVEYRGDFEGQISKVNYACGNKVTDTLAVIAVNEKDIDRLRNDVTAITFIEFSSAYVLQDIDPSQSDNIGQVKANQYLNLNGKGVLVGMIDTGINYLNKEFIREDGTSRIISIWDQTIQGSGSGKGKIGTVYSNEQINKAINIHNGGGNSYDIVPSKDEIDHGTKMSGIIGARGYNGKMQGIAHDCDFIVVKLMKSPNYMKMLRENNIQEVPVYDGTEVLSGIEYLRVVAKELRRPLVIYLGVGSNDGSHDGYNMLSTFIGSLASKEGIVFVVGTGNTGDSDGHVLNFIKNVAEISTVELQLLKPMKKLELYIWIQKPDRMSLKIIDPSGAEGGFYVPKIYSVTNKNFFVIDTELEIICYDPETFTGHQVFVLRFSNIKQGIWKLQLRGEYITKGRYDIWLPSKVLLPDGTKFLSPNPYNTLTVPSTARKVTTVAYYNSINDSILSSSGKGFNTNMLINPDIAAAGINVLTTSGENNNIVSVSGSSVATAIVAGASCLLVQWQLVDKRYRGVYSTKLRSLLIYSAKRERDYIYPNADIGYGKLDLQEVFYVLGGDYRSSGEYIEYYIRSLFVRFPIT